MTDLPPTTPVQQPVQPLAPAPRKSSAGLVSLILGVIAFITAVIPGASFATWAFAIAAIIFGIVGLTGNRRPRVTAFIGLGLAVVAWIVAIFVSLAFIAGGAAKSLDAAISAIPTDPASVSASAPAVTESKPSASEPSKNKPSKNSSDEVAIGETVKNGDDVSFTVTAVKCGLASAGTSFLKEKAKGQFCQVKFTIDNGSSDSVNVSASDVTGQIGAATYDSNSSNNKFDGDYFATDINPGLSAKSLVYFDIPKGKSLETLTYDPPFSIFTAPVVVSVK